MTITELIGQLKRTFATIRLYSLTHENARIAEAQLLQALNAYLDRHGSLCLVVRASTLEVDDKKVYEDERKEESLVRALFVDGVESLTLLAGIDAAELSVLVRAWYGAITYSLDAEQSFATQMWENELRSVTASIRPGIADIGAEDSDAAKAAEGRLRALYAAITAESTPEGPRLTDAHALTVMRAVLGDVSPEALARRAEEEAAVGLALSMTERQQLASGLGGSGRGSGQRVLLGLSQLWTRTSSDRQLDVATLVTRLVKELVDTGRVAELARAVTRIDDPLFREALADPAIVGPLVADASSDALTVLGALPPSCVDVLADPFAAATSELRARLAPIIAELQPGGETLATWLLAHGARVVMPLFELCESLDPSARDFLIRAALVHDEPEVVLRGLSRVPPDGLGDYRSLVEPRLHSPHVEVRRAALGAFARGRDPAVPALLEAQIGDPDAAEDWQKSCVHLLSTFGGPSAARVLVGLVENHPSREVRVAATMALGHNETPEARRVIELEANKLIGDRALKKAAKEVLLRWEKRRNTTVPPPPGDAP